MPTIDVVVGTNWLFIDAPVLWCKHGVLDPLAFYVVDEIQKGLCLGPYTQSNEHRRDLVKWLEGKGHHLLDVSENTVVTGVSRLKSELLYLLERKQINITY